MNTDPRSDATDTTSKEGSPVTTLQGSRPVLSVKDLVKAYPVGGNALPGSRRQRLVAVDHVSFDLAAGQTLGVVGESGCGKSTLARCIMGLESVTEGSVLFNDRDIAKVSRRQMRHLRQHIQMVFQDPYDSLNPRRRVVDSVMEPMLVHRLAKKPAARRRAAELFEVVGLSSRHLDRYPREFSGGQRQRIGIARALASNPQVIVADEPVSALDVSVQAQVINLLCDLQEEMGLTYVFISHNLDIIRYVADRIAVMYLGQVMELAGSELLSSSPAHPYTVALLGAVPDLAVGPDLQVRERIVLNGDVPNPINRPPGCPFAPRCPVAQARCIEERPELRGLPDGRLIACHFPFSLSL
ncbi:ABC transporter ATP-binding protein [Leekyejoonella antrihumi]|uniref:ATP-binding cassette domain-containing protein n=1 Tax=Leekyejoonella antrihumi TaxID=1660198 RepID=A0A563DYS2_9MICO|nr:oligopeptide/dipeptide ABC transporter ATP-binding protein [Leekyejoonella antrihumi]TWP35151.1 ATP-binding cassette domain-containing protein [Leekyejoonella antrihumi]